VSALRPLIFGKYCLLERVSVGGMAEVFRARPFNAPGFKRFLAVKRILPNLAEDDEFISMFVDEAKIAVQLNHRHVCQIYELGRLNDSYYIVMEYIAGRDLLKLQQRFRKQKRIMSVTQAGYIASCICDGLDYSHRKVSDNGEPLNIIHRDVSPQNVLISFDGEVKVIDFGIARAATQNKQTQVGVLKGKFGYMSPEQVAGEHIDHRSDVFAVGVLLWEMLTARRLFRGQTDFATLELVRSAEIDPPSKRNKRVPPEMDAIVMKALARDRDVRYQWASEMADDLREFLARVRPPYTDKTLSGWMVSNFREELEVERARVEQFKPFVTVDDVIKYNEEQVEVLDDDDLLLEELEDEDEATRVFDPSAEEVLAENDDEPMATVVMSTEDIRLPDAEEVSADDILGEIDDDPDIVSDTGPVAPPTPTDRAPVYTGAPPSVQLRPRRSGGAGRTIALVVALIVLLVAGVVGTAVATKGEVFGFVANVPGVSSLLPPASGTLIVNATPSDGVEVRLDGELIPGALPLEIPDVLPGSHFVEFRHPDYETLVETVEIPEGGVIDYRATLSELGGDGTVVFNLDEPTAQLYLDGQLIGGQGDRRSFSATARERHVVEVLLPGHFVEVYEFEVPIGGTFERDVEFRPVVGRITVGSQPGGTATLDGEEIGSTDDRPTVEDLPVDGVFELVIQPETPGYRTLHQTVIFDTYYDLTLQPRLPRLGADPPADLEYGYLATGDASTWYRVLIDGRETGLVTPIGPPDGEEVGEDTLPGLPLRTGSRTITFARGGQERNVSVSIVAGETLRVNVPEFD